jgi:putative spermidine/putrescine transport system ATP-binding protein
VSGGDRPVSSRPEQIRLGDPGGGEVGLQGKLVDVQYHGPTSRYEVDVEGKVLTVAVASGADEGARPREGEPVRLAWPRAAMVELEPAA